MLLVGALELEDIGPAPATLGDLFEFRVAREQDEILAYVSCRSVLPREVHQETFIPEQDNRTLDGGGIDKVGSRTSKSTTSLESHHGPGICESNRHDGHYQRCAMYR